MDDKEYRAKRIEYEWDMMRFHEKIAYLSLHDLIPEHMALFYEGTFRSCLGYVEKFHKMESDLGEDDAVTYELITNFCKKHHIKPYKKIEKKKIDE